MRTMQYALKLRREADALEKWADQIYRNVAECYGVPDDAMEEVGRRTGFLRGLAGSYRVKAMEILDGSVVKAGANNP